MALLLGFFIWFTSISEANNYQPFQATCTFAYSDSQLRRAVEVDDSIAHALLLILFFLGGSQTTWSEPCTMSHPPPQAEREMDVEVTKALPPELLPERLNFWPEACFVVGAD